MAVVWTRQSALSGNVQLLLASTVGFAAMQDAANFDGLLASGEEQEPIVADSKPELVSSLERLYIALARIREAMQGGENTHGTGLVQAADISLGQFSPEDALHVGSL
jgi:hypothetical protein